MQKYLHLLQIVETEKTVAKQLRQQIEDGEIEIERLKAEVTAGQGHGGSWLGTQAPDPTPHTPGSCRIKGAHDGQGDQLPAIATPASKLKISDAGRVGRSCCQIWVHIPPLPLNTCSVEQVLPTSLCLYFLWAFYT